jgi:hypothetical protein
MDRLQELIWRIDDNPLDETARCEYELLIAAESPNCREVRFLALERELCDARGNRVATTELLHRLSELMREFTWDDRGWTGTMPRRFDLWLDHFNSELRLALTNALRIGCNLQGDEIPRLPTIISKQLPALGQRGLAEHLRFLICRYERRPYDPPDISDAELAFTIWPSWIERN